MGALRIVPDVRELKRLHDDLILELTPLWNAQSRIMRFDCPTYLLDPEADDSNALVMIDAGRGMSEQKALDQLSELISAVKARYAKMMGGLPDSLELFSRDAREDAAKKSPTESRGSESNLGATR